MWLNPQNPVIQYKYKYKYKYNNNEIKDAGTISGMQQDSVQQLQASVAKVGGRWQMDCADCSRCEGGVGCGCV